MKRAIWLFVAMLALPTVVGCRNEGPAERAGEEIDNAAQNMKDGAENAADDMKDAAD
jgi:hypothetical protein